MIDTLLKDRARFQKPPVWDEIGLKEKEYLVMTLHRPANVDEDEALKGLMDELLANTRGLPLVFPVHPRTAKMLKKLGIGHECLHMIEPLGYPEFNCLVERSKAVVTDSGGDRFRWYHRRDHRNGNSLYDPPRQYRAPGDYQYRHQ